MGTAIVVVVIVAAVLFVLTKSVNSARWALIATLFAAGLALSACGSSGSSATPAQKVAALDTFASAVKSDLATCASSAEDVLTELGLILQAGSTASTSDLVDLDTSSQNAQTACDETKDNALVNLGTTSVPGSISGMDGLGNVPIEAESWASDDVDAVLKDIQNIAASSGSEVADAAQLQTDEASADSDSTAIYDSFSGAAGTLNAPVPAIGLVNFEGNS